MMLFIRDDPVTDPIVALHDPKEMLALVPGNAANTLDAAVLILMRPGT